jgi:hypothetical protein
VKKPHKPERPLLPSSALGSLDSATSAPFLEEFLSMPRYHVRESCYSTY